MPSVTRPAYLMASTSPFTFCNNVRYMLLSEFVNCWMWDGNKNKLEHELELVIGPAGVGLNPWLYQYQIKVPLFNPWSFSTSRLFKYYYSCDIYSLRPFLSFFFLFINSDHIIATRKNRLAYKYVVHVVDNKLFNHLNHRPFTILLRVYAWILFLCIDGMGLL